MIGEVGVGRHATPAGTLQLRSIFLVSKYRKESQPFQNGRERLHLPDCQLQFFPALVPGNLNFSFVCQGNYAASFAHFPIVGLCPSCAGQLGR